MASPRNTELKRRLERLWILSGLKTAAFWSAIVIGSTFLVALLEPGTYVWLRDDRLGPPAEMRGTVVQMYVSETAGRTPYRPPTPIVKLENGRQLWISNPYRVSLLVGDRVIVEERTYVKSGKKRYRILRAAPDEE